MNTTVYDEIVAYCAENNLPLPSKKERSEIGYAIGNAFRESFPDITLEKVPSKEIIWVRSYPQVFIPQIREAIESFFAPKPSVPPKETSEPIKKRKRKVVPVYTTKK